MVHYDICHHNEPLSCMGAKASQPTHFLEFRLTGFRLNGVDCIPVGEPGCPLSTGVRGHNHSLVSLDGPRLLALDHDFHIHGIVPSITFVVDTPEKPTDSFFNGQPFVITKDKVTQPSSAIRHATELTKIASTHYGQSSVKPIMIVVSDGGPTIR